MARLSFRCDDALLRLVDEARGDVARELWLRKVVQREAERRAADARAIEQALRGQEIVDKTGGNLPAYVPGDPQFIASHDVTFRPSGPARSSVQAKRGTGPRPKAGEK